MKHNVKITILLISMFLLTQFIGIYVVNYYSPTKTVNSVQQNVTSPNELPFGLEPPPMNQQVNVWMILLYMLPAFVIAIGLFFLLTKLKAEIILKGWFFLVVIIALAITLMSFLPEWSYMWIIAVAVAATLAFFKIYKRNFIVHNLTELLIYPGIAAVFVSLLSSPENPNRGVFAAIALLILISFYDMWAVWRSKIMQKMAKYQIDTLKIFSGFFIPYASKSVREKMKKMKKDKKNKGKKVKVNIAILGGGDVVFPIITSGVVLRRFGFTEVLGIQLPLASLLIIAGAALGLGLLFAFSEKKKFYPAMPFISAGIFVAMGLCYLIF